MTVSFSAGQLLTAAQMTVLCPVYTVKTLNQVVTNSVTLVNDADLVFTLLPNQTYAIDWDLLASSSAGVHGIDIGYAVSGTVAIVARSGMGPAVGTVAGSTGGNMRAFAFASLLAGGYGTDTSGVAIREHTIWAAGVSGGTVTLKFAQDTLGAATTTTLLAGSNAIARIVA